MKRNYKLYVHISPSNKRYYGITSQKVNRRWKNGNGYKYNEHFYNAIKKYGWDNFTHEILFDNLTEDEAKLLEQMYIAIYDTNNQDKGYNISLGGDGSNHSEETIEKIRKSLMNNPKLKGKNNPIARRVINLETKEIFNCIREASEFYGVDSSSIGQAIKHKNKCANCHWMYYEDGMEYDIEIYLKKIEELDNIKRIEFSRKRKEATIGKNNPNYGGKSQTDESIRNMADKHMKKVRCVELDLIFNSIKDATIYFNGKSKSAISNVLKGRSKTAYKYHWEYVEENIENIEEAIN